MNKIILIAGATGVGTTTCSFELAKKLNIQQIISTDVIREVIRGIIHPQMNPSLNKSTYSAGITENYETKTEQEQRTEIIRAYKNQASAVELGIEQVISRMITENIPAIIEGIHLVPGRLYEKIKNRSQIKEYLVTLKDEKAHSERFQLRSENSPERNKEKYLARFKEIRWIHDYLIERAERYPHILTIDNQTNIDLVVNKMIKEL